MIIGFIGMTHLGLNSAVAAAERGVNVVCFDPCEQKILALKQLETEINEPGLRELMHAHQGHIEYSNAINDLAQCDLVYIALDVETDDLGSSNLAPLKALISLADEALPSHILLVVLSQIPPGFSRALQLPSQRPYLYQVETLIFGDAINRALNPERIIVGAGDPEQALPEKYVRYLERYECPILPMRFESAELCKISINCCLVASVSIANTLAELCEQTGADWSEIVPALKSDRRIGQYAYLSPGLGIAGGNLERDLHTVIAFSQAKNTDAGVVHAYLHNSAYRKSWPLRKLQSIVETLSGLRVAVWGLSYKVDTHSLKNSPSIHFIESAAKASDYQIRLSCFDPVVTAEQVIALPGDRASSPLEACEGADVLVVLTPWPIFSQVDIAQIKQKMAGNLVLDPYKALSQSECEAAGLRYFTLGKP